MLKGDRTRSPQGDLRVKGPMFASTAHAGQDSNEPGRTRERLVATQEISMADASVANGAGSEAAAEPSLRQRVIAGSAWTMASFGLGQLLRFVSNIVLARLLS